MAVIRGALVPPKGSPPQLGGKGLLAGERLLVDLAGNLGSIALGSLKGDAQQQGDATAFANLPPALTVEQPLCPHRWGGGAAGWRPPVAGPVDRPIGRGASAEGGLGFQLLLDLLTTIDATLPNGLGFTPLGLLR